MSTLRAPGASDGLGGGLALLLLLADGRLPAGGHAHSGGIEEAVGAGRVGDLADLEAYLHGRLVTTGRVEATVAVASWYRTGAAGPDVPVLERLALDGLDVERLALELAAIDAEASARVAAPAQRAASRAQGRGLLRVARRCWSDGRLDRLGSVHPDGPLAPVVLGAVGAVGALGALEVATAALWSAQSGPAWAAVRLLGLDPLEVTAALARLTPGVDREASEAAVSWGGHDRPPAELPAAGAPLTEIGAEAHAAWEVRLFAS